jgi:N-acetylmuramoyl-L-alanine amidase
MKSVREDVKRPMIAICVGHSRRGDSGAVSVDETSEREFNRQLAALVAEALEARKIPATVIYPYEGSTYGQAMTWLAGRLRKADLAVELHFNSSSVRAASGHEWLYLVGSHGGRESARCLERAMKAEYPGTLARGCKALGGRDNGFQFLAKAPCPAVIAEPFFGTNADDWALMDGDRPRLARTLAAGLAAALDILTGKGPRP